MDSKTERQRYVSIDVEILQGAVNTAQAKCFGIGVSESPITVGVVYDVSVDAVVQAGRQASTKRSSMLIFRSIDQPSISSRTIL